MFSDHDHKEYKSDYGYKKNDYKRESYGPKKPSYKRESYGHKQEYGSHGYGHNDYGKLEFSFFVSHFYVKLTFLDSKSKDSTLVAFEFQIFIDFRSQKLLQLFQIKKITFFTSKFTKFDFT